MEQSNGLIWLKENDDIADGLHPMGRLSHMPFSCSFRCLKIRPFRIALRPDGKVIFQCCDGVYPVVGDYTSTLDNIEWSIRNIIQYKCSNARQWLCSNLVGK